MAATTPVLCLMEGRGGLGKPRRLRLRGNHPQQDTTDEAKGKDEAEFLPTPSASWAPSSEALFLDGTCNQLAARKQRRTRSSRNPSALEGKLRRSGFYPPNKRRHQIAKSRQECGRALVLVKCVLYVQSAAPKSQSGRISRHARPPKRQQRRTRPDPHRAILLRAVGKTPVSAATWWCGKGVAATLK